MPRDEPGRFDDLLSEADVERLVCSTAIRYPAFRLVRQGRQLEVGDSTSKVSWRPPFTSTADVRRAKSNEATCDTQHLQRDTACGCEAVLGVEEKRIVVARLLPQGDRVLAQCPVEALVSFGRQVIAGIAMQRDRTGDGVVQPIELRDRVGINPG